MDKTETVSDNELVAKFMGHEWDDFERKHLDYQNDWNCLMALVEKISTTKPMNQAWFDVKYHLIDARIEVVYQRAVDFIKWHNSQPHKP